MAKLAVPQLKVIGWREWVVLPDLELPPIKAKIDTGARSSALHAFDCQPFRRSGEDWLRFNVHPLQRNSRLTVQAEALIIDERLVRSSSGKQELRWVVQTSIALGGRRHPIELTLTRRDAMGFRMLLGREALRGRFLVDPGASYLMGEPAASAKDGHRRTKIKAKAAKPRRGAPDQSQPSGSDKPSKSSKQKKPRPARRKTSPREAD